MAFARKFVAFLSIYWQETLAYRAATVIWILADTQTALIMPMVWLAAFGGNDHIFGMTPNVLVTYYLITLFLGQFIVCHLLWDIAWDIREGMLTTQMLRPFSVFWMNVARNLAWRTVKIVFFFPFLVIFLLAYGSYLGGVPLHITPEFVLTVLLGHTLSFLVANAIALLSLWTTEFQSVFSLYYFPESILSGRLVPLDSLPPWIVTIGNFLPFQFTVSVPANALLGKLSQFELRQAVCFQIAWIVVFALLGKALFTRGTRQYTGFGN